MSFLFQCAHNRWNSILNLMLPLSVFALNGGQAAGADVRAQPEQSPTARIHQHHAGKPYSFRSSAGAERFEVRAGDHWPLDIRHDGGRTERERSELAGAPLAPGADMVARFRFAVAPGAPTQGPWTIVAQVHQVDFPEQRTYTVPLLIGLEQGDRLFVRATANPGNSLQSFRDVVLWRSPRRFPRARFHQVEVALRTDVGDPGRGSLDVSIDGVAIVRYRGQVGIAGTTGYYWKHGIYRSQAAETTTVTFRDTCFGGPECRTPRRAN